MYSITRYDNQSLIGALGVLLVLPLSFLFVDGVEGQNTSTRYDPATRNDPAIQFQSAPGRAENRPSKIRKGTTRRVQAKEPNKSPRYDPILRHDPAIQFQSAPGRAKNKTSKIRKGTTRRRSTIIGGGVPPRGDQSSSSPVATLIFTNTLMEGSVSGNLVSHSARRNYYGDEEFSLAETRDLSIVTCWKKLQGDHLQTMHIYGPDGHLFQKRVVPFSTESQRRTRRRKMRGIENAVDVRHARPRKGRQEVTVNFPITGTWVSQHQMVGTWRVEVYHNEAKTPSATGSFTLTE